MGILKLAAVVIVAILIPTTVIADLATRRFAEIGPDSADDAGIRVEFFNQLSDCWNATKVVIAFPKQNNEKEVAQTVYLDISSTDRIVFRKWLPALEQGIIPNDQRSQSSFCVQTSLLPETHIQIHYGMPNAFTTYVLQLRPLSEWKSTGSE
jgi:hypothetical protein